MSTVVALLTRSPSDPRLKERLAPVVPDSFRRRDLVLAFIDDLVSRIGTIDDVTLKIAVTPPVEGFRIARPWIQGNQLVLQRGVGFGERLRNLFHDLAASGFKQIVLVGADVPDLPVDALLDAIRQIRANAGVVAIGPSPDGSFYLLGLTIADGVIPDIFSQPRWGSPHMRDDLEAAVRACGQTVSHVMDWFDVDTPDDITALADRLRRVPDSAAHTADALKSVGVLK